jgi:F0F1-type ATP synthase membrane subunit b/b'
MKQSAGVLTPNRFLCVSAPLWLIALQEPRWWDYPGFELWKFVNLALFVGGLVYLLTRKMKLGEAFKTRRDTIKQELAKAQQERDAALAKLKEVEDRLARLDSEVSTIREQSKREAAEESERIAKSTEVEVARLSEQAKREIERAGKAAKHELRNYAAATSVRLAEEIIRREMRPEDDARLLQRNVQELGGSPQ